MSAVLVKEWERLIPIQPHSEYPSTSAALCQASFEQGRLLAEEAVHANANLTELPPLVIDYSLPPRGAPFFPFDTEGITTVTFDTFDDTTPTCGLSRLCAGAHFLSSVPAGLALSKGIGQRAYEHVRDLVNGKVPRNCARCTRE